MKKQAILFMLVTAGMLFMTACKHESIEDRAARESKEYTEKNCPTPPQNNSTLDSVTFDKDTKTLTRHFTMVGIADNAQLYAGKGQELHQVLVADVRNTTNIEAYKEADFIFEFIYRSQKESNKILYQDKIKPEEYK